jgi:hypothetical protein
VKKVDLKDKVAGAYLRATGESNGWEVFLQMVQDPTKSQEDVARVFGVALTTSQRWHNEYRNMEPVVQ